VAPVALDPKFPLTDPPGCWGKKLPLDDGCDVVLLVLLDVALACVAD
jgi:hypothetical protein